MSANVDITEDTLRAQSYRPLVAGDTYDMGFTAQQGGTVIDLTGAKVWITIKEDPIVTDGNAKYQKDSDTPADVEIDDPGNGHFIVHFQPSDTENLAGEWDYDIQAKLASGDIITLGRGSIEFLPNITRATS